MCEFYRMRKDDYSKQKQFTYTKGNALYLFHYIFNIIEVLCNKFNDKDISEKQGCTR